MYEAQLEANEQAERIICEESHLHAFLSMLGVQHDDAEAWLCPLNCAHYESLFGEDNVSKTNTFVLAHLF